MTNQAIINRRTDRPGFAKIVLHVFTLLALVIPHPLYSYLVAGDHATFLLLTRHKAQTFCFSSWFCIFQFQITRQERLWVRGGSWLTKILSSGIS